MGRKLQLLASLSILLAAANGIKAADQPSANDKTAVADLHKLPKPVMRDPLVLLHEDLGKHNHSNTLFSVQADCDEIAFNDVFTPRQEPCVVGLSASFSF